MNWLGKYSVLNVLRTYVPVKTVLLRFGFSIGSRRSHRCRKPSGSGGFGAAVAGLKYGARVRGAFAGVTTGAAPAVTTEAIETAQTMANRMTGIAVLRSVFIETLRRNIATYLWQRRGLHHRPASENDYS